ncbi:MAG: molybdenum cofactor guanylyltransferase [Limisphaerales bacterium]
MKAKRKRGGQSAVSGQPPAVEVVILAGGLSSRMGRDKARLQLGGRSLLAWVRAAARATGWPVRVIRRDLVPRSGPLGGVWTAFQRSRAERLVFLSCDMPLVTPRLMRGVGERKASAVFTQTTEGAGFPFALDRACLPLVEQALAEKRRSLQSLAQRLRAQKLKLPQRRQTELLNLNTPEDFARARAEWPRNALARSSDSE